MPNGRRRGERSMKKLGIALGAMLILGISAWQYKLEILVTMAPKFIALVQPVGPNKPVPWQKGPDVAEVPIEDRPPNVVLILTDDLGFNDISLYNGGAADGNLQTPHIDAIAGDGVRFDNGYSANAVCSPSRATIMTGRYSTRFGFEFTPFPKVGATIFQWVPQPDDGRPASEYDMEALDRLPAMDDQGMPASEITLAEMLKEVGYYTAHIGKWHLGEGKGFNAHAQGFDDSLGMAGMYYLPPDHPDAVNAKRENNGIENMVWATGRYAAWHNNGELFEPKGYLTDYYTDEAIKVIENNKNRPFFLYLAHWGVHNPIQATRADYDKFSDIDDHMLRTYAAMIHAVDRSVGRITNALEDNGLADNTIVIFTSDNGGASYIGLKDVNKPYRGWKLTHFEGGTHVPFIMKWPARIPAGTTNTTPIHHVDLYRTIAMATGGQIPTDRVIDGTDLMPIVNHGTKPDRPLFWKEGHQQTVQYQGWKLIRTGKPNNQWLFDLNTDPTEQTNLADSVPEKMAELTALLDGHAAQQAAPLWPSIFNSPVMIDKHDGETYQPGDEVIYWPN